MDSSDIFINGHRALHGDDTMAPSRVSIEDPCPFGLREMSSGRIEKMHTIAYNSASFKTQLPRKQAPLGKRGSPVCMLLPQALVAPVIRTCSSK